MKAIIRNHTESYRKSYRKSKKGGLSVWAKKHSNEAEISTLGTFGMIAFLGSKMPNKRMEYSGFRGQGTFGMVTLRENTESQNSNHTESHTETPNTILAVSYAPL